MYFHIYIYIYIYGKFQKINKTTAGKKFAADRLLAVNESLSDILSALSVISIVFVSSYLLLTGSITMGTLMALVQLSSTFVMPVVMLMQNVPKISGMKPIIERLAAYTREAEGQSKEEKETEAEKAAQEEQTGETAQPSFFRQLTCEHVCFSYEEGKEVLSDLNLTLKAGEKYALLGESGCGKSTLLKLLTGFTRHFTGNISYDGCSVKALSPDRLAQMIAVIHQNVFLFDTDIYDNICLGNTYTQEELDYAVEASGIGQFLPSMEKGLHTLVGENGQYLSGGQRQRIAVARALIRRTPILIIDEGTSAVDRQTACEIEKRLLMEEELTVLAVTHHMNRELQPMYNRIFEMKEGCLYSSGL